MKFADFFTLEGKKALRQMIFLGKFVEIDRTSIDQTAWKENFHYEEKKPFHFIQNTTIYPEALQKILPVTSIFPCDFSRQRNEEKYAAFQKQMGMQECVELLQEQFVLYQIRFVKDWIEIKIISILPMRYNEDTYVFPVGKRKRQFGKESLLVESLDSFEFPAYPEVFGLPCVFYLGRQIFAVERNFVVHLPIEEQIEQMVFKNDRVAVVQFQKGFLLYESEESTQMNESEESSMAIVPYQEDHRKSEAVFFAHLRQNLRVKEVWVDEKDLLYFHASLKTQAFTLVKGIDAQRVCEVYAKTLGAAMGESLFYLYPKSGWGNMYDLLLEQIPAHEFVFYQYPNLMTFLARANENPERLFFCVIVDMDFARPEHYLHQFLYVLQGKRTERVFQYRNTFHQLGSSIEQLVIGDNVLFIGIPNLSEISYPLTRSCLDKMSTVTFNASPSFVSILEEIEEAYDQEAVYLDIPVTIYRTQWLRLVDPYTFFTKGELQFFDTVNELLADDHALCKIHARTLHNMANMIANGFFSQDCSSVFNRRQWIDRCIRAFVIEKMVGSVPSLQKLLGRFDGQKFQKGECLQLFESEYARKISHFTDTIETIKMKIRRYEDEGFFY